MTLKSIQAFVVTMEGIKQAKLPINNAPDSIGGGKALMIGSSKHDGDVTWLLQPENLITDDFKLVFVRTGACERPASVLSQEIEEVERVNILARGRVQYTDPSPVTGFDGHHEALLGVWDGGSFRVEFADGQRKTFVLRGDQLELAPAAKKRRGKRRFKPAHQQPAEVPVEAQVAAG